MKKTERTDFFQQHYTDADGHPAGGITEGRGFLIHWQRGPLGRIGTDERAEPNGAFVEDIIAAIRSRLEFYQNASNGRFACEENAQAIASLERALSQMEKRTQRRIHAKVEGTHEGN